MNIHLTSLETVFLAALLSFLLLKYFIMYLTLARIKHALNTNLLMDSPFTPEEVSQTDPQPTEPTSEMKNLYVSRHPFTAFKNKFRKHKKKG